MHFLIGAIPLLHTFFNNKIIGAGTEMHSQNLGSHHVRQQLCCLTFLGILFRYSAYHCKG